MSILKMDNFGNIVEDNGEGGTRSADMVADDNVAKLSIKEDGQVVKDRLALKKIDDVNTEIAAKQASNLAILKAEKAKHARTNADILHNLQQKMAYLSELKANIKMAQALLQGRSGQYYEKMSGVSGHGLTADGRRPEQSTSFYDYAPIVDVNSAFGSIGFGELPVGFDKLSASHKAYIEKYVLANNPVLSGNIEGRPFSYDIQAVLTEARNNPNFEGGVVNMAEYDAAKQRGWGNSGYIYKEGTKWVFWPYKAPFHPNVLYFKNIDMTGRTTPPDLNRAYAGIMQALDAANNLGIRFDSIAQATTPVQPVAVAPVQTTQIAPPAATVEAVQVIQKQEAAIDKAIVETQKAIEAQIQTTNTVAAATVPTANNLKGGTDYRHPMLSFNLVQKTAPLAAKKEKLLFGLGRPNYTMHTKGGR